MPVAKLRNSALADCSAHFSHSVIRGDATRCISPSVCKKHKTDNEDMAVESHGETGETLRTLLKLSVGDTMFLVPVAIRPVPNTIGSTARIRGSGQDIAYDVEGGMTQLCGNVFTLILSYFNATNQPLAGQTILTDVPPTPDRPMVIRK